LEGVREAVVFLGAVAQAHRTGGRVVAAQEAERHAAAVEEYARQMENGLKAYLADTGAVA
jgi:hypothetical protein